MITDREIDVARILEVTQAAMKRKLAEHSAKGRWTGETIEALLARAAEEILEFVEALDGDSIRDVEDEAADVQNFFAMIVDVWTLRKKKEAEAAILNGRIGAKRYGSVLTNIKKAEAKAFAVEQRRLRLRAGGAHVSVLLGGAGANRCTVRGVTIVPTVDQRWNDSAETALVSFADGSLCWFPIARLEDIEGGAS
jgi:NTP pyrophosphatase (non-canonical NTP hydrolase)